MVKSTLLYGAETWKPSNKSKKRVEVVEMNAIRRSIRLLRTEKDKERCYKTTD